MQMLFRDVVNGRTLNVAHTTKSDGDMSVAMVDPDTLARRRADLVDMPWHVVRQIHSDRVIDIDRRIGATSVAPPQGIHGFGDALVTNQRGQVLAVHSGDCVTVAIASASGRLGVAHGGWQGLFHGVIETLARSVRCHASNRQELIGVVGPHISPYHYEFGSDLLDCFESRFGTAVRSTTRHGKPALDLGEVVSSEFRRLAVRPVVTAQTCTASNAGQFWSHRARSEPSRVALMAWWADAS